MIVGTRAANPSSGAVIAATAPRPGAAGGTLCGMANPFLGLAHRRPEVDMDEAARLLLAGWGRVGVAHELGSHQDRNYLVEGDDGRFVLKIARHGITRPELEAENVALAHLAAAGLSFAVPVPVPALDGSLIVAATTAGGATHDLRLVTFIEGVPLDGESYFSAAVLRAHGAMGAELVLALAGFDHPGLDRAFQWDLKHAADICEALAPFASTPERRALLDASIARAMTGARAADPRAAGPGRARGHHRPEHARDP